jgi:hypothetical protein
VPEARVGTVILAIPLLSGAVPNVAVPSEKVTLPVALLGEIVAVNVTAVQGDDGFNELLTESDVGIGFTVCDTGLEHCVPGDCAIPLLTRHAVSECTPTVRVEVVKDAVLELPPEVTEPSEELPSKKLKVKLPD